MFLNTIRDGASTTSLPVLMLGHPLGEGIFHLCLFPAFLCFRVFGPAFAKLNLLLMDKSTQQQNSFHHKEKNVQAGKEKEGKRYMSFITEYALRQKNQIKWEDKNPDNPLRKSKTHK